MSVCLIALLNRFSPTADPNISVLLLVDEIIKYEKKMGVPADACLSQLCKLLDYKSTGPRTYMIVTSLRQIRDTSEASHRPLHWAKLNLLGHSPDGVDYSHLFGMFKPILSSEYQYPTMQRVVRALNGHARPLARFWETLKGNTQSYLLDAGADVVELVRSNCDKDQLELEFTVFQDLLLAIFDGLDFNTDQRFGQPTKNKKDENVWVTAGSLQEELYLLSSTFEQGRVDRVLSPAFIAVAKPSSGSAHSFLQQLLKATVECANWMHFEKVAFWLVAVRSTIYNFDFNPAHRGDSVAFPFGNVDIVSHYTFGRTSAHGNPLVPIHTNDARHFKLARTSAVHCVTASFGFSLSEQLIQSICTAPNVTYVINFDNPKQKSVDVVVVVNKSWYGIQVAHTTGDGYLNAKDKIIPALERYSKFNFKGFNRGPLVFLTNKILGHQHYDSVTREVKIPSMFQSDLKSVDNKSLCVSSLFIVNDHIDKLLTPSFHIFLEDDLS